jgi:hypothetical protein
MFESRNMTIEEALKRIKQSAECFITWRMDTGEIVKVNNLSDNASHEENLEAFYKMTENVDVEKIDKTMRFAGGIHKSEKIDRKFLEVERDEYLRLKLRVEIFNQWTAQPVTKLIAILETGDFPYSTTEWDACNLLERIFDFHWQEIGEKELKRFWKLFENKNISEKNKILLKFHLLFFERRLSEFIKFYKQVFESSQYWISNYTYYYIGDLQISDEHILKHYQENLSHPQVFFSVKYPVMIALGKIGNTSGEKSAEIIEKVIFDGTEAITKAKNLVLQRIRTPAEDWKRCPKCRFGRVTGGSYGEMIMMEDCAECIGLGWIKIGQ